MYNTEWINWRNKKIQMITPNDWCYYVTIENINGRYLIAENGADA